VRSRAAWPGAGAIRASPRSAAACYASHTSDLCSGAVAFEHGAVHRPATILVEIDAPIYGEREAAAVVQRIIDHGYCFVDQIGWTHVFRDVQCAAAP